MDEQPSEFFLSGLQKLEQWNEKCIELHGEYVEIIPSLVTVACFLPGRAKDVLAPPRIDSFHVYIELFIVTHQANVCI